jgi:hypothetical protein
LPGPWDRSSLRGSLTPRGGGGGGGGWVLQFCLGVVWEGGGGGCDCFLCNSKLVNCNKGNAHTSTYSPFLVLLRFASVFKQMCGHPIIPYGSIMSCSPDRTDLTSSSIIKVLLQGRIKSAGPSKSQSMYSLDHRYVGIKVHYKSPLLMLPDRQTRPRSRLAAHCSNNNETDPGFGPDACAEHICSIHLHHLG